MRKGPFLLAALLLAPVSPGRARDILENWEPGETIRSSTTLSVGYRNDTLGLNSSGSGGSSDALSELRWKDLQIYQVRLTSRTLVERSFYMRTYITRGWIESGRHSNSRYS